MNSRRGPRCFNSLGARRTPPTPYLNGSFEAVLSALSVSPSLCQAVPWMDRPAPSPAGRPLCPGVCPYVQGLPLGGPWSWDLKLLLSARPEAGAPGWLPEWRFGSVRFGSAGAASGPQQCPVLPGSPSRQVPSPPSAARRPSGARPDYTVSSSWLAGRCERVHLGVVRLPCQPGSCRACRGWPGVGAPQIPGERRGREGAGEERRQEGGGGSGGAGAALGPGPRTFGAAPRAGRPAGGGAPSAARWRRRSASPLLPPAPSPRPRLSLRSRSRSLAPFRSRRR